MKLGHGGIGARIGLGFAPLLACVLVLTVQAALGPAGAFATAFGTATLALGVALAWWLHRGITGPLRHVTVAAQRMAAGDLSVPVDSDRRGDR